MALNHKFGFCFVFWFFFFCPVLFFILLALLWLFRSLWDSGNGLCSLARWAPALWPSCPATPWECNGQWGSKWWNPSAVLSNQKLSSVQLWCVGLGWAREIWLLLLLLCHTSDGDWEIFAASSVSPHNRGLIAQCACSQGKSISVVLILRFTYNVFLPGTHCYSFFCGLLLPLEGLGKARSGRARWMARLPGFVSLCGIPIAKQLWLHLCGSLLPRLLCSAEAHIAHSCRNAHLSLCSSWLECQWQPVSSPFPAEPHS